MNLIPRNRCVINNADDLVPLYTFKNFPVFMGCTTQMPSQDLTTDMSWSISKSTGIIQLNPLIPLEVLYHDSHGAGGTGRIWEQHHQEFARFIHRFEPRSVLEIGGGHGILATNYQDLAQASWTILEPNPTPGPGCKAKVIKGFFDDQFQPDLGIDTIVHSHVFEHIYEPLPFLKRISEVLKPGQKLIFSLPNMRMMLEKKYLNFINFEHTLYLAEYCVEELLRQSQFRVVQRDYFLDDHSIFYAVEKTAAAALGPVVDFSDYFELNKKKFSDFIQSYVDQIPELLEKIAAHDGPTFIFGAHVFAQYLIAFGLKSPKIEGILDNDKNKQGKRLYGTPYSVSSPTDLREIKSPQVILRAGAYNQEIRGQILGSINANTEFI